MENYYILFYETSENYIQDREAFRVQHLAQAKDAQEAGHLLLAGALEDPADEAILIFRAHDPFVVEDFAKADPYVQNGVVKHWKVSPWKVVMGSLI